MVENSSAIRISLIFIVSIVALSCNSSSRAVNQAASPVEQGNPVNQAKLPDNQVKMMSDSTRTNAVNIPIIKDQMGPDDIRLYAKLIRILPPSPAFTAYPCSKYPCQADIEVIEIVARGR